MFDVIVIGVGGMGSAAVYHLAHRGAKVLGLEQFDIPHDFGSSHGLTRIIRLAYWEHPAYVPLLRRAYHLWHALEAVAKEPLLITTGSIDAGPAGAEMVLSAPVGNLICRTNAYPVVICANVFLAFTFRPRT